MTGEAEQITAPIAYHAEGPVSGPINVTDNKAIVASRIADGS
jgi:hypothetical protein